MVFAVLFGGVVGAFLSFFGVGYLQTYARLKQSTPVPIQTVSPPSGAIELVGTAHRDQHTSRTPFTDTESLIHQWEVRERRPAPSDGGPSWTRLASGEQRHAFRLDDDTGAVRVNPQGASLHLQPTRTIEVAPNESPPPPVAAFLQSHNELDSAPDRPRRYQESRLDPGTDVHVLGPARVPPESTSRAGRVNAVIGVDAPADRGISLADDSPATMLNKLTTDADPFIITNAGEAGTERQMLTHGALLLGLGLLFLAVSIAVPLLGG
jgi:hypothetical protein